MRPVRWGALVATGVSAVIVGCSAPPPPEVPAPPPPPQPAAQAEAAAASKPELGAFKPLFGDDVQGAEPLSPRYLTAYPKGSFAYIELLSGDPGEGGRCPVAHIPASGCQFYRMAGTDGVWGEMKSSVHRWAAFSPGKDAIYATRASSLLAIDEIDAEGDARLFYEDERLDLARFVMLELSGGKKMIVGEGSDMQIQLISVPDNGEPLGKISKQPIRVAQSWAQAAWARERNAMGDKVAMDSWSAAALRTATGEPDATGVFVWVEAIPPAKYSPRLGTPKSMTSKLRSKNGCGGPPSRPLSDESVVKKLHLMRISAQGKVLADKVPALTSQFFADHPGPLSLQIFDGGFSVGGLRFSNTLAPLPRAESDEQTPQKAAQSPFVGHMPPVLVGAGFDAASGEGIVLVREGDTHSAQLIDASGRPKSSAWQLTLSEAFPGLPQRALARIGEVWVALHLRRGSLIVLSGKDAGKEIQTDGGSARMGIIPLAVVPGDERRARVVLTSYGASREVSVVNIDLPTASATTLVTSPTRIFTGGDSEAIDVFQRGDELMFVGWRQSGAPWRGRMTLDGTWFEEPMEMSEELGGLRAVTIHTIYRDRVVVLEGDNGTEGTWASTGQRVSLSLPQRGQPAYRDWFWNQGKGNGGPFLRSGAWVLAGKASDVVSTGEDAPVIEGCLEALPTSAHSALLVCAEPEASEKIGGRLGTRLYSF